MNPAEFTLLRGAFEANGFVHVRSFLSELELAEVRENVQRYQNEVVPRLEGYRVLYDVADGQRFIKQMSEMDKADGFFAELLGGAKARSLAEALLGEEAVATTLEYFDKGPRIGKPTPPHQDGYYFCLTPNHAVTMWVALDDCDLENGCMSYVIGSHRQGVIVHQPSGVVGFSQGLQSVAYGPEELFVATGRAGDCFAHHSLTIHLAGANRSDRHRRSLGLIYYGVSSRRDEAAFERYQASLRAQRQDYPVGAAR